METQGTYWNERYRKEGRIWGDISYGTGREVEAGTLHQKEWGAGVIGGLQLRSDAAILDLGCGDGVLTAKLAALVPQGRVLGIDLSAGMIQVL